MEHMGGTSGAHFLHRGHARTSQRTKSLPMVHHVATITIISVAIEARAILRHSTLPGTSARISRSNSHGDEARDEGGRKKGWHGGDEGDAGHEDEESEDSDDAEGDEAREGAGGPAHFRQEMGWHLP